MALASYLEMYTRTIVTLAFESDPGILIGAIGKVDGVVLLKSHSVYSQADAATPLVKGDWPSRIRNYGKLFGSIPTSLSASAPELEKLRRFRNGVGHAFGRDLYAVGTLVELAPAPLQRLSEDRLKKWMGVTETAAKAIEKHLVHNHIGAYELVRLYHDWPKRSTLFTSDQPRSLKREIGTITESSGPSIEYFKGMVRYYRSV
jgi:hypothetical protein